MSNADDNGSEIFNDEELVFLGEAFEVLLRVRKRIRGTEKYLSDRRGRISPREIKCADKELGFLYEIERVLVGFVEKEDG